MTVKSRASLTALIWSAYNIDLYAFSHLCLLSVRRLSCQCETERPGQDSWSSGLHPCLFAIILCFCCYVDDEEAAGGELDAVFSAVKETVRVFDLTYRFALEYASRYLLDEW